jgi:hypothetical protein
MKITLFKDKNPAVDEYVGESIGLFIGVFCLLGLWKNKYSDQFGVVLFNHAFGVWLEEQDQ